MKSAIIQATLWAIIIFFGYGIKRFVVDKWILNYLQKMYSTEDAERTARSLSFGLSIIILVLLVFVIIPKIFNI